VRRVKANIRDECIECGRITDEPRLGLCPSCYHRRRRGSPARAGATCEGCGERDLVVLESHRWPDGRVGVTCRNCSHRLRVAAA